MKKSILLTAALVMMSMCASAQMFSVQADQQMQMSQQQMQQFNGQQTKLNQDLFEPVMVDELNQGIFITDMGVDPIMDIDHGGEGDTPGTVAPIGSGAVLLVAMGAAYAAMRRRKEMK